MCSEQAAELFLEGIRMLDAGDGRSAESLFREAVALQPGFAEAHANLALVLERRGEQDPAEASYRKSLQCESGNAQTQVNYGAFLFRQKRFREAEAAYRQAIKRAPAMASAWTNLGVLLACLKREGEAEAYYRHVLRRFPDERNARFNLSYLLLRQGRFDEGWQCLEARTWPVALERELGSLRWNGQPIAGKSVIIGSEAGYGDVIHLCRYAATLKEMGASRVVLAAHPSLKRLLRSVPGLDDVVAMGEDAPPAAVDYWVPLFSLPYHCKTRAESIPARLPYLQAAEKDRVRWLRRLPSDCLKVGVAWHGSPSHENDADRSLPGPELLHPLRSIAGVQLVSLQAGESAAGDGVETGLPMLDFGPELGDFSDTAALVSCLDLVVSVDTAVAHLAGALGTRCWVLLPDYRTDWRWLAHGDTSPWYPGIMRLFRQPAPGDWLSVLDALAAALTEYRNRCYT